MEPTKWGSHELLEVLLDVYQNKSPDFFHLSKDRLWVSDLTLQEDGSTALELQCFDLDGNECLHRALYRMEAESPTPYCWFTDEAVMLLHAPEDPADPEEDKALTLRWFPLDTLEEQVWRIEPDRLPGLLSGVVRHWSRDGVLTVEGTFLQTEDIRTACLEFDLERRGLSVSKPGLFGVPGKKEPPEDGPDPEHLVADEGMCPFINYLFDLPDGMSALPISLQADETRCRVEFQLVPPNFLEEDNPRTVTVTGSHCGGLFPFTIEGCRCVMIFFRIVLPCMDLKGPFPGEETSESQPLRIIQGKFLEVECGFADAHLTRSCRELALYRDDKCYRWRFDYTAWAVCFELPALFASVEYVPLIEMVSTYCGAYISRCKVNGDRVLTFDTLASHFSDNWKVSSLLLKALPADYRPPRLGRVSGRDKP